MPVAGDDGSPGPIPTGRQPGKAFELADGKSRLDGFIVRHAKDLDAAASDRIAPLQFAARRLFRPAAVHDDVVVRLHAPGGRGDDAVRRIDDVRGRAIVLD